MMTFGDVKKYLADLEEAKKVIAETNAIDSLAYQQGILDARNTSKRLRMQKNRYFNNGN